MLNGNLNHVQIDRIAGTIVIVIVIVIVIADMIAEVIIAAEAIIAVQEGKIM
jgi:hypothetical protein